MILVDGNNFYNRLKELHFKGLLQLDYQEFGKWLAGGRKTIAARYYIGAVRAKEGDEKSQTLLRNQHRLFAQLQRTGWSIHLGYLLKTANVYHEKGVDVLMAVDLLVGAYEHDYDTAILVSSDTDLLPAMDKVRKLEKQIEYVGFGHCPSFAMQAHASVSRLIVKSDIVPFLRRQ
ncbi:MAG: NYN domain-containing protein [Candidatus Portnoybacteria bacterium]|nr:NYN domain-containing protein [Candidatus Portnoybacteria bacterium]